MIKFSVIIHIIKIYYLTMNFNIKGEKKMGLIGDKKIGFLGGGRMAEAIFSGMITAKLVKPEQIYVTDILDNRLDYLEKEHGVNIVKNTVDVPNSGSINLLDKVDIAIVATHPQSADDLLKSAAPKMDERNILIMSIMGGVSLSYLEGYIKTAPVIRVMPNTPMQVNEGVAGLALGKNAKTVHGEMAREMFNSIGLAFILSEELMDPLTAVSGCGPAYAGMFIQALADGGVQMGLSRDMSVELAAQVLIGTGRMVIDKRIHPEVLKDNVCTPGGGTIAGVRALENGNFRATVMSAVENGLNRMREVGKKNN